MTAEPLPDAALSFPEVFELRARARPAAIALETVRFVKGLPVTTPHSFAELLGRAQHSATVLTGLGVRSSDRVVLSLSDPALFFSFLLGAQCIGAIPVPVPSAADLRMQACFERIGSVARDSEPRAIVLDDGRAAAALPDALRLSAAVQDVSDVSFAQPASGAPPEFRASRALAEIAFLQYTSGSTEAPKGVTVLHGNAIANLRAISKAARMTSGDAIFSWLPLFHDMGLVAGLLLGLYLAIPTYVATPSSFITRPATWLRAIHAFRATFSGGPNFAFDVLARRVAERALEGLDLSSWRLAFDGAELVDPETVETFIRRFRPRGFAPASFCPGYGLAEATLVAAFSLPEQPVRFDRVDRTALSERGVALRVALDAPNAVVFTSVGTAVPEHRIRILDDTSHQELPERCVGEIVVSGPSVTPGYFAELQAGSLPRTEIRTGDLGYLADGELYIVDRLKDILVLAGRKYAPTDLERVLKRIDGIRPGAIVAFSTRGQAGTEDLYIAVGLEPRGIEMKEMIALAVHEELRKHFDLTPAAVFLLRPGQLPRTSSGKLRRSACRSMVQSGVLGEQIG